MKTRVAILGAGSWGSTLAILLHGNGCQVRVWEIDEERVAAIATTRQNTGFLPDEVLIPEQIEISTDLADVVRDAESVVLAVPSHTMREVARKLARVVAGQPILVSVAKGIENGTLKRMSEVIAEEIRPDKRRGIACLSGPSIANEVLRNLPATVVCASREMEVRRAGQLLFVSPSFRVYSNEDIIGVELGGSLKNVIALAAGIGDGLGLGANAKGALLTRGLAEITRLGVAMGAEPLTFAGLSGAGDLITTCTSAHSRNRYVGEQIALGRSLDEVLSSMVMVAEGVRTTRAARELARRSGVEMPITEQMHEVLFDGKEPRAAIADLMEREPKAEVW
ncbi:glycerol-3-phosphate dehydrogenase [candidate division TA06 bacterium DG_24]|uniref:Glycerol-3-phosphate dehydrogenase [NAD(P)+] n=1 Tax=candidate division TA06 bacterium DG_24 TaxID=1703770 RepID=A0A0S7WSA4_UNCT6|nr:MAG: glycerol-3-phosphate dehydrogenase [candidate division TA06 bacterium DG_24]